MELAIDSSSNSPGIALSHQEAILAQLSWQSSRNHTVELLPSIAYLLHHASTQPSSLEAIIVARGPGTFNGLRTGLSIAKGLAFSLNIPLLGIGTLEAEAYPFAYTGLPVRPIHKAGREEIATALYQQVGDEWRRLEEEHLTTLGLLCSQTDEQMLVCCDTASDIAMEIGQNLGKRAIMPQISMCPRVISLAMLGWRRLKKGEADDVAAMQPLYLRPPHITKPKK